MVMIDKQALKKAFSDFVDENAFEHGFVLNAVRGYTFALRIYRDEDITPVENTAHEAVGAVVDAD
jgi:hypothetical protein